MSGPALNPIASIAPAAPPKGLDASNQDVAAQSESDKAGTGFASELQRQMKGNPPPDDGQGAKSASDTDTEAAARAEATAQAHPPVQPELAALLGGLIVVTDQDGEVLTDRLPIAPMRVAVCVPEFIFPTSEARAALPKMYTRADAIYNTPAPQRARAHKPRRGKGLRRAHPKPLHGSTIPPPAPT